MVTAVMPNLRLQHNNPLTSEWHHGGFTLSSPSSQGCKLLFRHDLTKNWGKHCHSCVYCHSVSKKLVTAQYGGSTEEFCSEECRSKYTMLFCHVSKTPRCGYQYNQSDALPRLSVYPLFSLRLQSVTPAAVKGNWSRVSPCWEKSNTSVTWRVCCSSARIKWPRRVRSSKVCILVPISSYISLISWTRLVG